MAYLVDSNLLARLANKADIDYYTARNAIFLLRAQGDALHTSPQNLIEFRNVATRPLDTNGLGLAPSVAEKQAALYERLFSVLPETPEIYPAWKELVQAAGVVGKQVHDARLVAVCHVHAVTHVLTFNVWHFARFAGFWPGLIVVSPRDV